MINNKITLTYIYKKKKVFLFNKRVYKDNY